jgi:hypothetical protein
MLISMDLSTHNTDDIQKRLDEIVTKLENIEAGIKRNDVHNDWIVRMYFVIKDPIVDFCRKIGIVQIDDNTVHRTIRN